MNGKFFIITIVAVLMSCGGGKTSAPVTDAETDTSEIFTDSADIATAIQYDVVDALSMGLNGHVQSVSCLRYSTYESNGELKDGDLYSQYEINFDNFGHLTTDEWGNKYGYDAEGKYYRGNHTYTTVVRDKSGRIVKYSDLEEKKDNESQFVQTFRYDKNGRITAIEYSGGFVTAWTEKRQYTSGNIYPSKRKLEVSFEGGGAEETTETFRYTSFDGHDNWTERLCMVSTKEIEEEPTDSFIPSQPKITEAIQVEKRNIVYYE
jgi:YD repeat-containing protein